MRRVGNISHPFFTSFAAFGHPLFCALLFDVEEFFVLVEELPRRLFADPCFVCVNPRSHGTRTGLRLAVSGVLVGRFYGCCMHTYRMAIQSETNEADTGEIDVEEVVADIEATVKEQARNGPPPHWHSIRRTVYWYAIESEWVTVSEVKRELDVGDKTAKMVLNKMADWGLLSRQNGSVPIRQQVFENESEYKW